MSERTPRIMVAMPLGPDTLTASTAKATWRAPAGFRGRVLSAQLSLRTTGATSGATTVDVNKAPGGASPATILPAAKLSIPQGAAGKNAFSIVAGGVGHPNGVPIDGDQGDTIEVDVDAIPGTASTGAVVFVEIAITNV